MLWHLAIQIQVELCWQKQLQMAWMQSGIICSEHAYAGGAEALEESPSAFERWCDNRMIETMRPQKYQAFSVGPLVAYIVARENEIKTVRIILTGKQNQFPEEAIRERIREMYG